MTKKSLDTPMKLKLLASFGAVVVAAGVLTACSSPSANETKMLELWLPPFAAPGDKSDEDQWDEIVAPFEEKHGVDVNVTIIPWASYEEKYLTGVSGGVGPDVGYMYTEMMGSYLASGDLAELDAYLSDEEKANYLYLEQGQVNGVQYALPIVVGGVRVLYYNQDILSAAGVTELPVTWDDYLVASAKVTDAGFTSTLQEWGSPHRGMLNANFFPLLWQSGGSIFNDDGSATAFNSDAGVEAAEFLYSLKEDGHMPDSVTALSEEDARSQFLDGDVAFWNVTDSRYSLVKDAGFEFGFIASLTHKKQATFVAADSLVMLNSYEDKDLGGDLMNFILSGEQMAKFHAFVPYPPIGKDEMYAAESAFATLYGERPDILNNLPIVAGSVSVYNSLYTNLQQMMLGEKTPQQALEDAAEQGDAALSSAG